MKQAQYLEGGGDMRRRRVAICIAIFLAAFWMATGVAAAHFLNSDSVDCGDNGCEIRYEEYTKYDEANANAIDGWESIAGGVNIAPDIASTVTDLEVTDYSDSGDNRCGFWDPRVAADRIALNKASLDNDTQRERWACVIHEWGHAHRLAHSFNDQVMDDCPVCDTGGTYINPQNHDRDDYNQIW